MIILDLGILAHYSISQKMTLVRPLLMDIKKKQYKYIFKEQFLSFHVVLYALFNHNFIKLF